MRKTPEQIADTIVADAKLHVVLPRVTVESFGRWLANRIAQAIREERKPANG